MLICFTGLHAAGKSYFVNKVPQMFGFKVYDKKEIVKSLYYKETGKTDDEWNKWFGQKFEENPEAIIREILGCMPQDEDIILDAVHSNLEWELIHQIMPNSHLAVFITPKHLREERWEKREESQRPMDKYDQSRLKYWHNPKAESRCLLEHTSWSFNGAASDELNIESFWQFISYCKEEEKEIEREKSNNPVLTLRMKKDK